MAERCDTVRRTRTGELVTVSEFRARLAEMINRAERGEEVVIARGREPVAKLVGPAAEGVGADWASSRS